MKQRRHESWAVWKICTVSGYFIATYCCVRICAAYGVGTDGRLAMLVATLASYVVLVVVLTQRRFR